MSRKRESPEETVNRWIAGSARELKQTSFGYSELMDAGWEPGTVGHLTVDGVNYEKYELPVGGYVVVDWDESGNIGVS